MGEAVLSKYPQLYREDLVGINDIALANVQRTDRDELKGRAILPKDDLIDVGTIRGDAVMQASPGAGMGIEPRDS